MTLAPKVAGVTVAREEIEYTAEVREALAAVTGAPAFRFPLAPARLSVELAGVPTAVANGLRRVLGGELKGRCLSFEGGDFDVKASTDPFMRDYSFVRRRVRMVPLRPQLTEAAAKSLRFSLHAVNGTSETMVLYSGDLAVTAGALPAPIFNPTIQLAFLQPGKALKIDNIRVVDGFGHEDAAFAVACRPVCVPLDVKEHPRSETHAKGGKHLNESGYTQSSLVADPRRHRVSAVVPAAPADPAVVVALAADACANIMKRLKYARQVLEKSGPSVSDLDTEIADAYYVVSHVGAMSQGVLGIRGETHTIGNILARAVYEHFPQISFVGYTVVDGYMRLVVKHDSSEKKDVKTLLAAAIKNMYAAFNTIATQIRSYY